MSFAPAANDDLHAAHLDAHLQRVGALLAHRQIVKDLADHDATIAAIVAAAEARGRTLPLEDLRRSLWLAPEDLDLLVAAAAPRLLGRSAESAPELAAVTSVRTLCALVAADHGLTADDVMQRLADDAPLVRHGLLVASPHGHLEVPAQVLEMLRGASSN